MGAGLPGVPWARMRMGRPRRASLCRESRARSIGGACQLGTAHPVVMMDQFIPSRSLMMTKRMLLKQQPELLRKHSSVRVPKT